jgi:CubicO group peptidase (beta-lactamase class C family)
MKKNITQASQWMAVLAMLTFTTLACAQDKAKQIDDIMRKYTENRQFNGSVLVAENGKVIFKKGYGMANMEWAIPNATDTKFRLGSITKQFTSMLIMQLVEKGKLKLDGKITDYLPDYPKATGDKITIHHLLTHTSGIPSYTGFPKFFEETSRDPYTPDDFVKKFSDLPLEFEPGSTFAYDNSGYFLLGVIIEKATGKTYAQVLQENIFTPLQMKNTGYDLFATILPKRATGYDKRPTGFVNAPYLDMSIPYAAGSLYSTVEDLYLWDQALYSDKLLSAASKATMFKPFLSNYAYGWGVGKHQVGKMKDSVLVIEHGGGINGFNTLLSRNPQHKHLVVLLNNTGGTNLNGMRDNILNILYNQPVDPPKKSVAQAVAQELATTTLANALKRFSEIKKLPAYNLNEMEMNGLVYSLLGEKKIKESLAVFNLNAEEFPQSSNVYDSRGEAYMANGEKSLAIQDYKKSLELNPQNTNAVSKLAELGEKVAAPATVVVDGKVLDAYVGKYELAPSFVISITKEGTQLYGQATGQPRFELFPESDTKFFLKVVQAKVQFLKNGQGATDKLILFQNGQEMPGKRVN